MLFLDRYCAQKIRVKRPRLTNLKADVKMSLDGPTPRVFLPLTAKHVDSVIVSVINSCPSTRLHLSASEFY